MPTNVSYGRVIGQWLLAVGDSTTPDTPDATPAAGTITFTPSVPRVLDTTATPNPVTITPQPVACTLDADGYLTDGQGNPGVWLVATDDPDNNPTGWTYTVRVALTGLSPQTYNIAVAADTTSDMSLVAPVPSSPGTAITRGSSAYEIAVANGFVGTEAEWLASLVGPAAGVIPDSPDDIGAADADLTVTAAQTAPGYWLKLNIDYIAPTSDPESVMVMRRHTDGTLYRAFWLSEAGNPRSQAVSNEPSIKTHGCKGFFPASTANIHEWYDKWQGTRTLLQAVAHDGRMKTSLHAWTPLAAFLAATFTEGDTATYHQLAMRRLTDDVVELRGRVVCASGLANNQVVMTGIPAEFRPAKTVTIESINSSGAAAPFDIAPDGSVTCRRAAGTATWTAFDGKTYTL